MSNKNKPQNAIKGVQGFQRIDKATGLPIEVENRGFKEPKKFNAEQEEQIRKLAELGCTYEQIALVMKCDKSTLVRGYQDAIHQGWEDTNNKLRKRQIDIALEADPKIASTMLIWLGKNKLGQSDHVKAEPITGKLDLNVQVVDKETADALKTFLKPTKTEDKPESTEPVERPREV
jgi:hypothetical protein